MMLVEFEPKIIAKIKEPVVVFEIFVRAAWFFIADLTPNCQLVRFVNISSVESTETKNSGQNEHIMNM